MPLPVPESSETTPLAVGGSLSLGQRRAFSASLLQTLLLRQILFALPPDGRGHHDMPVLGPALIRLIHPNTPSSPCAELQEESTEVLLR